MEGLLRGDLLAGRRLAVAPGDGPALLARLGAEVVPLAADPADDAAAARAAEELGPVDGLLVDAAVLFAAAGSGAPAVQATLDRTWNVVRAVARAAWVEHDRAGVIVLLTPRPSAGAGGEAARAGLENMARTLSIEWARHGVRPVAVAPGDATADEEAATLCAYVLSAAGDYFAGTALDTL